MADLFSTPTFQNLSIPLIRDENHNNNNLLRDELMYQFDEEIEYLQLYPMSNNYNYKYNNTTYDSYTYHDNNANSNSQGQVDYHDILGVAIDGRINLNNKNTQIPVDIPQQHDNNHCDLDTYYYHQYLNNKPNITSGNKTNQYNNSHFPNNIPYLSSDEEDNTFYSEVIHTVPLKTKKQNQILKTKCIYEEFLKDYDSVSITSSDSHSTKINTNSLPNNEEPKYEFPITEVTHFSKQTQDVNSTFPRLLSDTFQGFVTSEDKYIPNPDQLHRNSITDETSADRTDQKISNSHPCIDKQNIDYSKHEEFNDKLQKKLHRYFSNADYLDKVRFQEISYRFSKTYH